MSPFYSISLTPLQVGTVTWHLIRAGRRGAPLLAAGQAAGRSQAAARRPPGSCSAGAGPTGGTNAFDLHGERLSAARPPPPRAPACPRPAGAVPSVPAGPGREVRTGSGSGAGSGPRLSPGASPGGAPSAGRRGTRRAKQAPHSLPAGLDRCETGQVRGRRGGSRARARHLPGLVGLAKPSSGAAPGPGLGRAGVEAELDRDSVRPGRGWAPGIPCWNLTTGQGTRVERFSSLYY